MNVYSNKVVSRQSTGSPHKYLMIRVCAVVIGTSQEVHCEISQRPGTAEFTSDTMSADQLHRRNNRQNWLAAEKFMGETDPRRFYAITVRTLYS